MQKQVSKWHRLGGGCLAGRWTGHGDVRGFKILPPLDAELYEATADLIGEHPVTGESLDEAEWWIFLNPTKETGDE